MSPNHPRCHRRVGLAAVALSSSVMAFTRDVPAQSRTPWQMNDGEGIVRFGMMFATHGSPPEYGFSRIPASGESRWRAAPNPDTIEYEVQSTLCDPGIACREGADFTYFRTVICIADPRDVSRVTVRILEVDDGARVTVFNSRFPSGVTPSNGYAFLGGGAITSGDFAAALQVGEPNTLVVTHVDDCCRQSWLRGASVLVNDRPLPPVLAEERCNGLDDDCNGTVDDLGTTTCGTGACRRTVNNCERAMVQTCVPGAPGTEVCNGVDDDCDGAIDEDLGVASCGNGPCRRTAPVCIAGVSNPCVPAPPGREICNGFDDDCNGVIDDVSDGVDSGADSDVRLDATVDSARINVCRIDLRLGGRAGPLGSCTCASAPGAESRASGGRSSRAVCTAATLAMAWLARRAARARTSRNVRSVHVPRAPMSWPWTARSRRAKVAR